MDLDVKEGSPFSLVYLSQLSRSRSILIGDELVCICRFGCMRVRCIMSWIELLISAKQLPQPKLLENEMLCILSAWFSMCVTRNWPDCVLEDFFIYFFFLESCS